MIDHTYKKKWGQNFIEDQNIVNKIISVINPQKNDKIIEIGPGKGALTDILSDNIKKLTAIEIDPLLCSILKKKYSNNIIEIINNDILNIDFKQFTHYNKIVGNLPYYITTPIIFKVLQHQFWDSIVFMVQKEVAERIIASPGNKTYGRLSVMVQVMAVVEKKFNISKNIFYPKPKVDSSLIKLTLKKNTNVMFSNDDKLYSIFSKIVKEAFGQRRKILKNSLKNIINSNTYDKYQYQRPEELSVDNYIEIATKEFKLYS